jgi:hypothetical protein
VEALFVNTHLSALRLLALVLLLLAPVSPSISAEPSPEWPAPTSAEDATRLAAQYIARHKFDVSRHRILPARYVATGPWTASSLGKGPYWQITYELPGHDGGQYFVLVYLNGKIGHIGGL